MLLYINLFGLSVPSYGLMIAAGVIIANIVALLVLKHEHKDFNDFVILEAYCMLGAFIGAKLLYLLVSLKQIQWDQITNTQYLNQLMQTGFVFYGGLIGGLLFIFAGAKIHRIKAASYIRSFIFLIPFIHCFGRIGCFMAGCCYGRPYDGPGAVTFPSNSFALPGVKLFPVQLMEAALLMLISIILLILQFRKNWYYTIETYLILYGCVRYVLEYYRYDNARGIFAGLSTSQWISLAFIVFAVLSIIVNRKSKANLSD